MTSPLLYLTADEIGTPTGGGVVTANELAALRQLGEVQVMSRENLSPADDPWGWDSEAYASLFLTGRTEFPKLCHIYSGTWPTVVWELKRRGCKVSVTIAAHDRFVSRREHESLGLQFPYPHLTDESLWQRYIKGYAEADLIICPSTVAADTVRGYGGVFESKPIKVIPHGCHIPHGDIKPLPKMFTVGYLGSYGADKGVRYLLEAWKKLAYRDAMLMLGGRDSTSDWVKHLIHQYGGGNIWCRGWMNNVSDFYNDCSLYVQPSASEGFGIEVLEAMAHGRPVLCSNAAGAVDVFGTAVYVASIGYRFRACSVDDLVSAIDRAKRLWKWTEWRTWGWREQAEGYTWDKIHRLYQQVWRELL